MFEIGPSLSLRNGCVGSLDVKPIKSDGGLVLLVGTQGKYIRALDTLFSFLSSHLHNHIYYYQNRHHFHALYLSNWRILLFLFKYETLEV